MRNTCELNSGTAEGVGVRWHERACCTGVEKMELKVKFSSSLKNRPIIIVSGYRFNILKSHGVKTYWRCSTHLKRGCRAVLHTLEDTTIIKCYNVHNH
ncbi:Modifier of mdg4 [Operophtera brumata]|uniref:Modifier of mdg4 n=1 Tax=Operophtera brumata TaxID=104452 RepID=A0A0L7L541_OPEBR|nr:Modifier of mdg4 [Operophtera brumata]